MSQLIELKNVHMSFSKPGKLFEEEIKVEVLRNIDFSIESGGIYVLVGESGCGKTTMGKIITGLLKPTKGKILFNGVDVNKVFSKANEYRKSVQFIQQDSYAALNPVRTIYQSLYAPIKNKNKKMKTKDIDQRIDELMALVGLNPPAQFLSKYPHQLSGGQRQRILMARAVSLDPKLIVADEPVSMIDVSLRLSILDLMKKLNEEMNIAFIYITHDLATANYIAHKGKMCVMYLGEIVEEGLVQDIIKHPSHPYTRALITAVPIADPKIAKQYSELPLKTMSLGNLVKRSEGCSFIDRCLYAKESCKEPVKRVNKNNVEILCSNLEMVPNDEI